MEVTKEELESILAVIVKTRKLVCDGAGTYFNPFDGDWAEELYYNNYQLTNAIKAIEEIMEGGKK